MNCENIWYIGIWILKIECDVLQDLDLKIGADYYLVTWGFQFTNIIINWKLEEFPKIYCSDA